MPPSMHLGSLRTAVIGIRFSSRSGSRCLILKSRRYPRCTCRCGSGWRLPAVLQPEVAHHIGTREQTSLLFLCLALKSNDRQGVK